jgi:aminoglycoside phosphotransferase (APT) family kinase protein
VSGAHFTLGWLPAALPADARRFRVGRSALAAALSEAGAELVETRPDVEIARAATDLDGDADVAIVSVEPPAGLRAGRATRAAARLLAAARVRARAGPERRRLHRLGYADVQTLRWDVRRRAALPGLAVAGGSLTDRVLGGLLVVGRRGPARPTALEAAVEAAGREAGLALRPEWVSIRPGPVLVATNAGVLRVAIGPGRVEVESQIEALDALGEADLPPPVADRTPRLLAEGRAGLARWSLERALPGERPPARLSAGLVDECLQYLVALHASGGGADARPLAEEAAIVAAVCRDEPAQRARALGERLDRELADVPRGFGHGDFFPGNLLARGDRLTGVLDWDAGGPGRLPLVDLLHLELTRRPYGHDDNWGRALVERLLAAARAGGDEPMRAYCAAAGLERDPRLLEALVFAYWLGYASYQLRVHPDRHGQRSWIEGNLERVLRAVPTSAPARGARTPAA